MWTGLSSRRKSNIKKRRKANCRDKGEEEGGEGGLHFLELRNMRVSEFWE